MFPLLKASIVRRNVSVVECKILYLSIACKRCSRAMDIEIGSTLPKDSTNILHCTTCKGVIKIETLFYLVSNSNRETLSKVVCRGGDATAKEVAYAFTCECGSTYNGKSSITTDHNCYNCHLNMYVNIKGLKITVDAGGREEKDKEKDKDKGRGGDVMAVCSHYKKSNRLFIFPCCNKRYSCDICHNEEEEHPAVMAKKMVCGVCGCEDTVKRECGKCHSNLTNTSSSSRFWEGGKGNRNKETLSKGDKRKYRK